MRSHRFARLVVFQSAVLSFLMGAGWAIQAHAEDQAAVTAPTNGPLPGFSRNPRRSQIVEVVDRVRAAVVNIHSERTVHGPASEELFSHAPSQNRVNGMGTGIVIDPRGYIVTNQHVVEDVNV